MSGVGGPARGRRRRCVRGRRRLRPSSAHPAPTCRRHSAVIFPHAEVDVRTAGDEPAREVEIPVPDSLLIAVAAPEDVEADMARLPFASGEIELKKSWKSGTAMRRARI